MTQTRNTAETTLTEAGSALVLKLQYEVVNLLARSETIQDALFGALKKIADSDGWDVGVFWSIESGSLNYQCEWHKPGVDVARLLNQIKEADSSLLASLPGKVLKTGGLVWIDDIRIDAHSLPREVNASVRLHNALAFPLSSTEITHGVIGLFRSAKYDLDDDARRVFKVLGNDIGQFIYARQTYEKRLEQSFLHDETTGVANQALLLDRGRQMLLLAERNDNSLAVLHVNLDFFKPKLGKDSLASDNELLVLAAERLSTCVRAYDTVARLVNNEFLVLLPEMSNADDALVVAQKIVAAMAQPLAAESYESTVNASIGIARHPQDGFDMPTLLYQANEALQYARSQGINQCALYSELAR